MAPAGEFDPELCKLVTYLISLWSYAEAGLLQMASQFLSADQGLVTEMLQAVRSTDARLAAVKVAGERRLADSPEDRRFFLTAIDALSTAERVRNRFAHHLWASSPDIPGAIILIDPRSVERATAAEGEGVAERRWQSPEAPHFDRTEALVYRKADLIQDVSEAIDAAIIVDGLQDWYGFLKIDARELAEHVRETLVENSPRLQRALAEGGELGLTNA